MTSLYSLLFPFLLIMLSLQPVVKALGIRRQGWVNGLIFASMSLLVSFLPAEGLWVGQWILSFVPCPSVPLLVFLGIKVWENLSGRPALDAGSQRTLWAFGLISGLALYPMALGVGPVDPYELGWDFSWMFIALMVFTLFLLFRRNRFGIILTIAITAYDLRLMESTNLWDYLVDPLFVAISLGQWAAALVRSVRDRFFPVDGR